MNQIFIRIQGGLGNQLFQYAFARSLSEKGVGVFLHWHPAKKNEQHDGFLLDTIFKRRLSDIIPLANRSIARSAMAFMFRKLSRVRQLGDVGFDKRFYEVKNGYIDGYFQSEKYFNNLRSELLQDLDLPFEEKNYPSFLAKVIKEHLCVAIHVRGGDYLKINGLNQVCGSIYYQNAIRRIYSDYKDENLKFIVFTDDMAWTKKVLPGEIDYIFASNFPGSATGVDFALMKTCDAHIISNSTFSWWGAWLSDSVSVIMPDRWYISGSLSSNNDIKPNDWHEVPSDYLL